MKNPPAAVLLSTAVAITIAVSTIRTTRAVTRLRETFNTMHSANWDEDVIKARILYAQTRGMLGNEKHMIADYMHGSKSWDKFSETEKKKKEEIATALMAIMNEYDLLALGIRLDTIDEVFLFKAFRGSVIRDWDTLAPLVDNYRKTYDNEKLCIEFQGLADSWKKEISYKSGKKLNTTRILQYFAR